MKRRSWYPLYKRKFTPAEDSSSPMKRTAIRKEVEPKDGGQEGSHNYKEASPLVEQLEENDRAVGKEDGYYQPRQGYTHAFPSAAAEDQLSSSAETSDLYKELKKFWNDGNPDIIKLGRAKIQYEENIGSGQKHIERFVWEVVRLRRFDLASVGSFDKFLVNSSPQEMMKAFFEGSAILQSISIRLALAAVDKAEKTTEDKVMPLPIAMASPLLPSSSFAPTFEKYPPCLRLNGANVRRAFWVDVGGDFRHINLTTLMESWRPQKGDVIMNLRACYRKIFSEITVDPRQIRMYSIRLSNKGRRCPEIKDLPQSIIDTLIDYTLAIFGLDHEELAEVDKSSALPKTEFVESLGNRDEERFDRLLYLASERRKILQRAPRLIQESLSDIRQSTVEIEQLEDGSCTINFRNNKRKATAAEVGPVAGNFPSTQGNGAEERK